jgi:23S rRNA (adenine2503-C2)-methyltransferase
MLTLKSKREFSNGVVYCLQCEDGALIETTDTYLPYYTKEAIVNKQNALTSKDLGSRAERWMIGVSVMSGCPVRCKFCATGQMKKSRNLTANEIVEQVEFVLNSRPENPRDAKEFKINYTRMGEPFLNLRNVQYAIHCINWFNENTHHYVSTIGVKGSDFSWIRGNITLQLSLHSLHQDRRDWLIPFENKMSIAELGQIRTRSNLKTTVNLTLVEESDFDINLLEQYFDKDCFFIKLSPINPNTVSDSNNLGTGAVDGENLC